MQLILCHKTPTQLPRGLVLVAIEFVERQTLTHMIQEMHVSQLAETPLHYLQVSQESVLLQYLTWTLGHSTD